MAIVKANYRTAARATRAGGIGRSVAYYTFRGQPGEARTWQASDGRELGYAAARREVTAQAREATYTYRIVLSTKEVPLEREDYREALGDRFDAYYVTRHHEGEHPHAHAIAFTGRRLDRRELQEMRGRLLDREQARERERDRERGRGWDLGW